MIQMMINMILALACLSIIFVFAINWAFNYFYPSTTEILTPEQKKG